LPIDLILAIPNQTTRRDAIIAYGGLAKAVENGAGTCIQQDDYGKLWRLNFVEPNVGDWYSLFVEVVNSTPRMVDDGTGTYVLAPDKNGNPVYDHYFLRVPPGVTSARDAVAWTGHFEVSLTSGRNANYRDPWMPVTGKKFAGFVAQS
jgi:hypothetical protein